MCKFLTLLIVRFPCILTQWHIIMRGVWVSIKVSLYTFEYRESLDQLTTPAQAYTIQTMRGGSTISTPNLVHFAKKKTLHSPRRILCARDVRILLVLFKMDPHTFFTCASIRVFIHSTYHILADCHYYFSIMIIGIVGWRPTNWTASLKIITGAVYTRKTPPYAQSAHDAEGDAKIEAAPGVFVC